VSDTICVTCDDTFPGHALFVGADGPICFVCEAEESARARSGPLGTLSSAARLAVAGAATDLLFHASVTAGGATLDLTALASAIAASAAIKALLEVRRGLATDRRQEAVASAALVVALMNLARELAPLIG